MKKRINNVGLLSQNLGINYALVTCKKNSHANFVLLMDHGPQVAYHSRTHTEEFHANC